nr:MAG TPA: hypothetical protein [Caudoviricetes sp.]
MSGADPFVTHNQQKMSHKRICGSFSLHKCD